MDDFSKKEWFKKAIINYLHYNKQYSVSDAISFFNKNYDKFNFIYDLFNEKIIDCLLREVVDGD